DAELLFKMRDQLLYQRRPPWTIDPGIYKGIQTIGGMAFGIKENIDFFQSPIHAIRLPLGLAIGMVMRPTPTGNDIDYGKIAGRVAVIAFWQDDSRLQIDGLLPESAQQLRMQPDFTGASRYTKFPLASDMAQRKHWCRRPPTAQLGHHLGP